MNFEVEGYNSIMKLPQLPVSPIKRTLRDERRGITQKESEHYQNTSGGWWLSRSGYGKYVVQEFQEVQ